MVSKKAGKQRQAQTDAPIHVRRKRIRARLVTDDPELQGQGLIFVEDGNPYSPINGSQLEASA